MARLLNTVIEIDQSPLNQRLCAFLSIQLKAVMSCNLVKVFAHVQKNSTAFSRLGSQGRNLAGIKQKSSLFSREMTRLAVSFVSSLDLKRALIRPADNRPNNNPRFGDAD